MTTDELTRALLEVLDELEKHRLLLSVLVDRGVLTPEDMHVATLTVELKTIDRLIAAGLATAEDRKKARVIRRALTHLP